MIELGERTILFMGRREIIIAADNNGNKTRVRTVRENGEKIEAIYHIDKDYNFTHLFSKIYKNGNKS